MYIHALHCCSYCTILPFEWLYSLPTQNLQSSKGSLALVLPRPTDERRIQAVLLGLCCTAPFARSNIAGSTCLHLSVGMPAADWHAQLPS